MKEEMMKCFDDFFLCLFCFRTTGICTIAITTTTTATCNGQRLPTTSECVWNTDVIHNCKCRISNGVSGRTNDETDKRSNKCKCILPPFYSFRVAWVYDKLYFCCCYYYVVVMWRKYAPVFLQGGNVIVVIYLIISNDQNSSITLHYSLFQCRQQIFFLRFIFPCSRSRKMSVTGVFFLKCGFIFCNTLPNTWCMFSTLFTTKVEYIYLYGCYRNTSNLQIFKVV